MRRRGAPCASRRSGPWVRAAGLLAAGLLALAGSTAASGAPGTPPGRTPRARPPRLEATGGWIRATLPGASATAAYLTLRNPGPRPVVVVGARCRDAQAAEMHTVVRTGNSMEMKPLGRLTLPPGGSFRFEPGAAHVMLIGAKPSLRAAGVSTIVLALAGGDSVALRLPVLDAPRTVHARP